MIRYSQPHYNVEEALRLVEESLRSGHTAGNGPMSKKLQEELCDYTGYDYCTLVNSATSGLFVAVLAAIEIGAFKQNVGVTTPALTFVATVNMALTHGLSVIATDNSHDMSLSGSDIGISYAGMPAWNNTICDDAHGLMQGIGWRGNIISVVSFHAIKQLCAGEGGAILTNDGRIHSICQRLVDQGRGQGSKTFGMGYNFRMPDPMSAIALSVLRGMDSDREARVQIAETYIYNLHSSLEIIHGIKQGALHLFPVFFESQRMRDDAQEYLFNQGIQTRVHYPPLQSYPHLSQNPRMTFEGTVNASRMQRLGLSLPMHPMLTVTDVHYIIDTINGFVKNYE